MGARGQPRAAKQAFAEVSPEARTKLPASRALVAAEIALAENDGADAIHELDTIAVPTQPQLAQNYWWLRGKAAFLTGHPVEGTRALVERERYLADAQPCARAAKSCSRSCATRPSAAHRSSRRRRPIRSSPAGWRSDRSPWRWRAIRCTPPPRSRIGSAPIRSIPATTSCSPVRRVQIVRRTPESSGACRPGRSGRPGAERAGTPLPATFPDQIALLLPLSGRAESVGVAVRDGFIAAYLEQDPATRPRLKIYDVAAESVAGAYRHAVEDGAASSWVRSPRRMSRRSCR